MDDELCENCGSDHNHDEAKEVPWAVAEAARIVIEKAMNMTLDPANPLNQVLVMGAGMLLDGIQSGILHEQTLDFENLLGEA